MTMGVFDFKSIRSKLERQEQKADFEEKNPKPNPVVWTPEWAYGIPVPLCVTSEEGGEWFPYNADHHGEGALIHSAKFADGREWDAINGWRQSTPVKSLAHPAWPYTGTPHEWPKF